MRHISPGTLLLACFACFLVGWLSSHCAPPSVLAEPTAPRKGQGLPFPMSARMGGNIYLQTAAEYRACCYGIYKGAELRLETALERARPKPTKPAVVMDLDETVLDNSAFQTFLYNNNLEYTDELWADYEENYPEDVALIPGAKQFIEKADALHVTVIFISNRSEQFQKATESALQRLGIDATKPAGRLYLRAKGGSTDKSTRREAVSAKYNVLMYFGDSLRDFSESFAARKLPKDSRPEDYLAGIKERNLLTDEARCHWGVDWFVLPNPVYGEWEKLIGPDPKAILHPTSMKKPMGSK
jgi:5'-nucleotidase (lipoprotein e(P4) family)